MKIKAADEQRVKSNNPHLAGVETHEKKHT